MGPAATEYKHYFCGSRARPLPGGHGRRAPFRGRAARLYDLPGPIAPENEGAWQESPMEWKSHRIPETAPASSRRSLRGAVAAGATAVVLLAAGSAAADAPGMARLEGGAFPMGRDDGPADERPAHTVRLRPFLIDRLPVTHAQFAGFLDAAGTTDAEGRRYYDWDDGDARIHRVDGRFRADPALADHPVNEASWAGARAFCRARGKRLPTEAEWERAARGAEGRRHPWGDAPPDPARARFDAGWMRTVPVGTLTAGATPEGVMDLAGNVHEWTSSLYMPYPYHAEDGREDPDVPGERVTRGGAADTGAETLAATWRGEGVSRGPRAGHHNIGFRCARDVP